MAGGHIGRALRRLRGLLGAPCAEGPTDADLLRRYVHARDEGAFEALLRRHGPMVLGVCRRLLNSGPDVDDAFQATFLVLVRKARSIGDGDRVGNWLYGVAYRVAVRARAQAARLRARQRPLTDLPGDEPERDPIREELRALLDEEVSRLPARYREAVVCCYLQGRTQEEAARVLGWPKGTVATRLNRARQMLRTRLIRRGLPLSAGTLVGVLRGGAADGAVPARLISAALQTADRVVVGGALPGAVSRLADAVLRRFVVGRIKAITAGVCALALMTGGGGLALRSAWQAAIAEVEAAEGEVRPDDYYAWRDQSAPVTGPDFVSRSLDELSSCPLGEAGRPDSPVGAEVMTADSKLLAKVFKDGTVCVFDPATGQPCLYQGAAPRSGASSPPMPGAPGARKLAKKADEPALRGASEQVARASNNPGCKVIITYVVDGDPEPAPGLTNWLSLRQPVQVSPDGRLSRSVVPPGTREMLIETRVWVPAARAFVSASKVVIHTTPPFQASPVPSASPTPPSGPGARPEAMRAKKCPRCAYADSLARHHRAI